MVFRNKNKSYGAYSLRRKYAKYVTLSLILTLFLVLSGLIYPVVAGYLDKNTGKIELNSSDYNPIKIPSPPVPIVPTPPPPVSKLLDRLRLPIPKIVKDSFSTDFGKQEILASLPSKQLAPTDDPGTTTSPGKTKVIEQPTVEPIKTIVQIMPEFPGGLSALYKYLHERIKFTDFAKETGITGTVYVTFVVEKDGSITRVALLRGIGGGIDEDVIKVVQSMPNWTPGSENGVTFRVQYTLPVKFVLQ